MLSTKPISDRDTECKMDFPYYTNPRKKRPFQHGNEDEMQQQAVAFVDFIKGRDFGIQFLLEHKFYHYPERQCFVVKYVLRKKGN